MTAVCSGTFSISQKETAAHPINLCSSRAIFMLNPFCLSFSVAGLEAGPSPNPRRHIMLQGKGKLASVHSHNPQEAHFPLRRPYKYSLMRQKDEFSFSFSILFLWCCYSYASNLFSQLGTLSLRPMYPAFSWVNVYAESFFF